MKRIVIALAFLLALPLAASADVTKEDILKLARAGISEDVILTFARKNGPIKDLTADDLVELKEAGVGERVLEFLAGGTEREEAEETTEPEEDAGSGETDTLAPYHLPEAYTTTEPVPASAAAPTPSYPSYAYTAPIHAYSTPAYTYPYSYGYDFITPGVGLYASFGRPYRSYRSHRCYRTPRYWAPSLGFYIGTRWCR